MNLIGQALARIIALSMLSALPAYGANSVAPRGVPPTIHTVSPSQLATSSSTALINISGSSFEPGARVELMFDVGPGAGKWSLPRHGFQVLSTSKIRLTVMPGPDNDQLRIRIVNVQGVSNLASVRIIKPAPTQSLSPPVAFPSPVEKSAIPEIRGIASKDVSSPSDLIFLAPPTPPRSSVGQTAVSTPQTLPPPHPLKVSVCGNKKLGSDLVATLVLLSLTAGASGIETACLEHDRCYARPPEIDSKVSCDGKFDAAMGAACNRVSTAILRKECERVRTAFIGLVMIPGNTSHSEAQKKAGVGSSISSVNSPGIAKLATATFQAATSTLAPRISSISPTSLAISTQQQNIVINGSGFDKDTRVEWMYGIGASAGEWRSPRNIVEVLSGNQLRIAVQSGSDPDQMHIRVMNKQGSSNTGFLNIVLSSKTVPLITSKQSVVLGASGRYPLPGRPSQEFGVLWSENSQKTHTGVDIPASKNTSVLSMSAGKVVHISDMGADWGKGVVVAERDGSAKAYLHVQPSTEILAAYKSGKEIPIGQVIGLVWKDHLHYNVCKRVAFCERGALPTSKPNPGPKYRNDPLFKDGPFVTP